MNWKYVFIFYVLQGVSLSVWVMWCYLVFRIITSFLRFACIATGVCTCILGLALRSGTSDGYIEQGDTPGHYNVQDHILNLNSVPQHARSHHCGPATRVARLTRANTRHCHVSKWKGPSMGRAKNAICGICKRAFKMQRSLDTNGLSTLWNRMKSEEAKENIPSRGQNKVWQKEVNNMIPSVKSVQGHPQIAEHIMDHVPGKTAKQIRRTLGAVLQGSCRIL